MLKIALACVCLLCVIPPATGTDCGPHPHEIVRRYFADRPGLSVLQEPDVYQDLLLKMRNYDDCINNLVSRQQEKTTLDTAKITERNLAWSLVMAFKHQDELTDYLQAQQEAEEAEEANEG